MSREHFMMDYLSLDPTSEATITEIQKAESKSNPHSRRLPTELLHNIFEIVAQEDPCLTLGIDVGTRKWIGDCLNSFAPTKGSASSSQPTVTPPWTQSPMTCTIPKRMKEYYGDPSLYSPTSELKSQAEKLHRFADWCLTLTRELEINFQREDPADWTGHDLPRDGGGSVTRRITTDEGGLSGWTFRCGPLDKQHVNLDSVHIKLGRSLRRHFCELRESRATTYGRCPVKRPGGHGTPYDPTFRGIQDQLRRLDDVVCTVDIQPLDNIDQTNRYADLYLTRSDISVALQLCNDSTLLNYLSADPQTIALTIREMSDSWTGDLLKNPNLRLGFLFSSNMEAVDLRSNWRLNSFLFRNRMIQWGGPTEFSFEVQVRSSVRRRLDELRGSPVFPNWDQEGHHTIPTEGDFRRVQHQIHFFSQDTKDGLKWSTQQSRALFQPLNAEWERDKVAFVRKLEAPLPGES